MRLTGDLEKKVEQSASRETKKAAIEDAGMLITDGELELVCGGDKRYVCTYSRSKALARIGPGKSYASVDSIDDGTPVYTTGEFVRNDADGITWYEIYAPIHGWIDGRILNFR